MIPLGMALVWGGYGLGLWGYVLVTGRNVTFGELFSPTSYIKKPLSQWPKLPADYPGLLPDGKATATPAAQSQAAPTGPPISASPSSSTPPPAGGGIIIT